MRGYGKIIPSGGGGEVLAPTITIDSPFDVSEGDYFHSVETSGGSGFEKREPAITYFNNGMLVYSQNFVSISARETNVYTKDMNIVYTLTEQAASIAMSPDETIFAHVASTSWDINIENWDGTNFVRLQTLTGSNYVTRAGLAFSPDGNTLIARTGNYGVTFDVYTWNGNGYSLSQSISDPASTSAQITCFAYDGTRLVFGSSAAPYYITYYWNGSEFVRIPNSQVQRLPGIAYDLAMSGDRLVILHNGGTGATFLTWNGTQYVNGPTMDSNPTNAASRITMGPNGSRFISWQSNNYREYIWDGQTYKFDNEVTQYNGVYGVSINRRNDYVVWNFLNSQTPNIALDFYSQIASTQYIQGLIPEGTETGYLYIAKVDATTGDSLSVYQIPVIR